MTIQELRVFLQEWFCGCGAPEDAADMLYDLLKLMPLYEHRSEFEALIPNVGIQYLLLYTLDHFRLIEHGGTIRSAWLSEKGRAVLEALREFGLDSATEPACIHGNSIELDSTPCPACAASYEPSQEPHS